MPLKRSDINTELDQFEEKLLASRRNFSEIVEIFESNYQSNFLNSFIQYLIQTCDQRKVAQQIKSVSRRHIVLIHNNHFDYSAWAWTKEATQRNSINWAGVQRVIGIRGSGKALFRKFRIVGSNNVNDYNQDTHIELLEECWMSEGDFYILDNPLETFDIADFKPPLILEELTLKPVFSELSWDFKQRDGSVDFVRMASLSSSRIRTMLEICQSMQSQVPDKIYDYIFDYGDPQLKLNAIQAMLSSRHPDVFRRMELAISDQNIALSSGAQHLFDRLMSKQRSI